MEEQFIIALANRSKSEEGLIALLPDDVKCMVEEKLSTELQDAEIVEDGSDSAR
jgi:hypothetical protein